MTAITINIESPLTRDARSLIAGSETAMRSVFSADECYTFSPEELDKPHVDFIIARKGNQPMGCAALVAFQNYVEVKRLFVADHARGFGIAKLLMTQLEVHSKSRGLHHIQLETGDILIAAVALYKQLGYTVRGPFGDYKSHPTSLFMEKHLG